MYDVIVVGGGPAGMTAALYALRNGKSALVIEKTGFGGQITHSPKVENYPGTLSMSGNEFADSALSQILEQGAEIEFETVTEVKDNGRTKTVLTEEGSEFEGKTVIIATGVKHRMLGLEHENELVGEGISFCAVCDGDFYKDKVVCVAGGGNSALQEAILLSDKCSKVIMLQDLPQFTGEGRLQDVLFARDNVEKHTNTKINRLITDGKELKGVEIEDRTTGEKQEITCDGLFVAIGLIPENEPFKELADLNSFGYFDTDESCLTKTPGVFVAGDCRSKMIRQMTTAVADGAVAALAACRYINEL
ncbi:MAG: FAD-dependent oxidoreductase [Clostridiales bacterium]|nr:FAD-dependent oxidoreductase [Clostridiales bacterium]